MSLGVSKECFPSPTKCYNCDRKGTEVVKKETCPKEDYKRCSNCHMMTYCDKDCQKEHWIKVHKSHCRFLSGKARVQNSNHTAETCAQCIEASPAQAGSENSPKTICNIELSQKLIRKQLNILFEFHGEGKKCNCSIEFACELPFPLGEVTGQYMEIGNTGLDAMLAHAIKIVNTMGMKAKTEEARIALVELLIDLSRKRGCLWYDVLVSGKPRVWSSIKLSEHVDSLKTFYGASNPWWKIISFLATFITNTKRYIASNFRTFDNVEDPRFEKLKQLQDYNQSQLQNQATVCEKKMWPNFMLWPQLVNGSLAVILPPGTRCQTCKDQLSGEVAITDQENYGCLPCLFPLVGDNGALLVYCSPAQKPSCMLDFINKNVHARIVSDEEVRNEVKQEDDLFYIEARDCDFCLKASLSSHRCSACLAVQYCSVTCQKKDLDFHKTVCSMWAKDKSRRIVGKGKQKDFWKNVVGEK